MGSRRIKFIHPVNSSGLNVYTPVENGSAAGSSLDYRYILFTDIHQSTRLCEMYPKQYASTLDIHNAASEKAVADCGGQVHRNTGDGYIAFFGESADCVACAVRLQREFSLFPPFADDDPLLVRIVAHGCTPPAYRSEYFDAALCRASRICQVCYPGQVLASHAVVIHAEGKLPEATRLLDLGIHHLRDLAGPEHLYQLDHEGFARREFPPLLTLGNRPNNLVVQPNTFIGRERELAELKSMLLDDRRLVTITSPGGYGKTRLAAHLCADLLEGFEGGVFFVELAPVRDHGGIPTALANATGFQFYSNRDPKEQLIDYLREKEMLICLDNFENVLEGASFISDILREALNVKVVVTSREPLRITGEQVYALEPLPVQRPARDDKGQAAAVLLFADRAKLADAAFALDEKNLAGVLAICRRLDGVPLSIELAAAWLDSFTVGELLAALDRQLELTARITDVPERHRSLRASWDWSWSMLGDEQQRMLMQLSTFHGGCFAEAASAVLGLKGMALRQGLSQLSDKGWLFSRETGGRARFLIRDAASHEYAFEKLVETRVNDANCLYEQAAMDHARYFSALMGSEGERLNGHGRLVALQVIGQEKPNIYEALDTLLNRMGREDAGAECAELALPIVRWLWWHLALTAEYQELLDHYQVLKDAFSQIDGQHRLLLWVFMGCSLAQLMLGDFEAAHWHARRAVTEAKTLGERHGVAQSLNSLGRVESSQGNYDAARELYAKSLAIKREIGDLAGVAAALNNLGRVEFSQGNYNAARELYGESLAIRRECGDCYGIAQSLNNLGIVKYRQGNYDAARELYAESLAIKREIGDRAGIAMSIANLGAVESIQGNYSAAHGLYTESLGISREIGARTMVAAYLRGLGAVESMQGNYDAARGLYSESLAIRRKIGDRAGIAASLNNLGNVEYRQGNYDAARVLYTESLAIKRKIGDRYGIALSLSDLGVVEFSQSNSNAACELYAESLAIKRKIGDRKGIGMSLAACASLLADCDLLSQAAVCLYGALHYADKLEYRIEPMERELLEQALEMIEHPETGLAAFKSEQLKAEAELMSLEELANFALVELAKLKDLLRESEADQQAGARSAAPA